MLLIFTKRRWGNYWQLLRRWFEHKIDELKAAVNSVAQSIDFTPVEEKLDDVKSDVADVKTAVEHIDFSTLAKETQATSNKNEVKQEIRNVAGPCIIPDLELPCLPFEKDNGFSGLYDDGDFYIGDFAPQAGDLAHQLFVGAIIKVTGDNATEEEFDGFSEGSVMSVAHTVSNEEAGYEQGLYSSFQEGEPIYGVTSEITWQKDHYYRVTGFHDIYDMTNHEVIEGLVITYEEVDPATITDMGKKIVEKLDELDVHDPNTKALASFFNITEATEYTALTPAEAIAIARDCQYNVMGTDWPIPTWLPTGVTEAQVESAAEGLGIPYHEPTQTA